MLFSPLFIKNEMRWLYSVHMFGPWSIDHDNMAVILERWTSHYYLLDIVAYDHQDNMSVWIIPPYTPLL